MRSGLVVVVALILVGSGCNQVFDVKSTILVDAAPDADLRTDLDEDGIADVEDPCIAAAADAEYDTDEDGVSNMADSCPIGAQTNPTDSDGDGLPNECDPFPLVPGDRKRCVMAFRSKSLSSVLWA